MSNRVWVAGGFVLAVTVGLFLSLASDDTSQYLVFSTWGTPAEVGNFRRLIDYYNATHRPEHPVKLSFADHASYTERLLIQAAARSMPDVIHLDQKDLSLFVFRGLLDRIAPYVERDTSFTTGMFLPELLPGCAVKGELYAVPHNFSTLIIYYNRDHFDAEGVPYPDSTWTWQTLRDAARRLTKRDASGAVVRYGCHITIILYTLIYQNGGDFLNAARDSCVIASPETEEAVQFLIDLSEKYNATWNILAQNLQWDDMFAGGRCSMIANGRWAAAWYLRMMPPGSIDIAPLPRGRFRKGAMVNHMMAISSESSKKDEAWEFVRFLVSDVAQRMVIEDGANIPAVRSVVSSDDFLAPSRQTHINTRVYLDELRHSVGWPFNQGPYLTQHTLQAETDYALRRILLGQSNIKESLQMMQDNVNRVIANERRLPDARPFIGSVVFYGLTLCLLALAGLLWKSHRRKTVYEREPASHHGHIPQRNQL